MVDDADYRIYNAITRGLDHEAKVMGDRIQWAITFTGGLFAASAILITIIILGEPPANAIGYLLLIMSGISAIGVIFSWTTRAGVKAAQGQFTYLCKHYEDRVQRFNQIELPRPFGDRGDHYSGNFSARVFPIIMIVCWGAAFGLTFCTSLIAFGAINSDVVFNLWPRLSPPPGL